MWRLFKSPTMVGGEVGTDCWVERSGDELLIGYFKSNSTGSEAAEERGIWAAGGGVKGLDC